MSRDRETFSGLYFRRSLRTRHAMCVHIILVTYVYLISRLTALLNENRIFVDIASQTINYYVQTKKTPVVGVLCKLHL